MVVLSGVIAVVVACQPSQNEDKIGRDFSGIWHEISKTQNSEFPLFVVLLLGDHRLIH